MPTSIVITGFVTAPEHAKDLAQRMLGLLTALVPVDGAVFYAVESTGEAVGHELFRLESECLPAHRERFHRLDPCHPRRFVAGGENMVRLRDPLAPRSFARSEYYRDFFRRLGIRYELELFLRDEGQIVAGVSLLRGPQRGDFADREIDALAPVRPFLELAVNRMASRRPLEDMLAAHFTLTPREIEVVRLVMTGVRNEQMARALFVSLATTHLQHIFDKVGVRSRTELAARVHALG